MNRWLSLGCLSLALGSLASAQENARSRLRPIEGPIRNGGVLHLATGRWTRSSQGEALVAGPEIVYANTCPSGYFLGLYQGERITDDGAIPAPGLPSTPSTSVTGGYDTNPGCASLYAINGFEIGYCTYQPHFGFDVAFYDRYLPLGSFCAVPGAPVAHFPLTSLPGSPSQLTSTCWTVGIDLTGTSETFPLTATGTHEFGWSYTQTNPDHPAHPDGPILAGGLGGSPTPCTGTDATRWDNGTASIAWPLNRTQAGSLVLANEPGTGMLNQDAFRHDPIKWTDGCFWFQGNPRAALHLELWSSTPDADCGQLSGTPYCFGDGTTATACPCGNNGLPGHGCDNSAATGGALLAATGTASLASDDLFLEASSILPSSLSLFLQGDASAPAGIVFGDGIRCAAGNLVRLNSPGGSTASTSGSISCPNASFPQPISARSASLGQPIPAGASRTYQTYYRDPSPTFCSAPAGSTWNVSGAVAIVWSP